MNIRQNKTALSKFKPVIVLLFLLVFGYFFPSICSQFKCVCGESDCKRISIFNILIEDLESICVILSIMFAVYQYRKSCEGEDRLKKFRMDTLMHERRMLIYKKQMLEHEEKRKAIEYMGYYKDNILKRASIISAIIIKLGAYSIVDKVPFEGMKEFTITEMKQYLDSGDIDSLQKLYESQQFIDIIKEANLKVNFLDYRRIEATLENVKHADKVDFSTETAKVYYRQFFELQNDICNELEYFAAAFVQGVADEDVVYRSLHQTYLRTVRLLYKLICTANSNSNSERYFTNVIKLYRIWLAKKMQLEEKEGFSR